MKRSAVPIRWRFWQAKRYGGHDRRHSRHPGPCARSEVHIGLNPRPIQVGSVYSWRGTQTAPCDSITWSGYFVDFQELHGDRFFGDDKATMGGFAHFEGQPVMVIGQQKGRDTKAKLYRNFGMPKPEGYRKAMRLMRLAEKFNRPVITLIDTAGAYPGIDAEERGQAEAIAYNLREMSRLASPVIAVVIGEGGSGGGLASAWRIAST